MSRRANNTKFWKRRRRTKCTGWEERPRSMEETRLRSRSQCLWLWNRASKARGVGTVWRWNADAFFFPHNTPRQCLTRAHPGRVVQALHPKVVGPGCCLNKINNNKPSFLRIIKSREYIPECCWVPSKGSEGTRIIESDVFSLFLFLGAIPLVSATFVEDLRLTKAVEE